MMDFVTVVTPNSPIGNPSPGSLFVRDGVWHVCCPRCMCVAGLSHHSVSFDQGAVTVTPASVCPSKGCNAHYQIKRGRFVWLPDFASPPPATQFSPPLPSAV